MRLVDRRTNALLTHQLTNRPTDTASYRGALSHLKMKVKIEWERRKKRMVENKRSWGEKEKGRMRGSKKERNKQERIKKDGEKKHLFFTQVCS